MVSHKMHSYYIASESATGQRSRTRASRLGVPAPSECPVYNNDMIYDESILL